MGRRRCGSAALIPLWALAGFGVVVGSIVGSFIGAWTWRWPRGLSIVHGRSSCDHCQRLLTPLELIPLVSYWLLGRHCATCGAEIHGRQFAIELACALIGGLMMLAVPWPVSAAGAVLAWLLIALAVVDVEHLKLPDAMTASLAATGLMSTALMAEPGLIDRLAGLIAGFGSLWLIARLYRWWRGRDGMGGGDAKMLGALGCWFGWQDLPLVLLGASLFGLALAGVDLARGRAINGVTRLPFGALLAAFAFPLWLFRYGGWGLSLP